MVFLASLHFGYVVCLLRLFAFFHGLFFLAQSSSNLFDIILLVQHCNPPKIPDSATVFYPRRMKETFKYSDHVLLKCKDGYFKSRGGVLSCQGSKQWTGDIICSRKFS